MKSLVRDIFRWFSLSLLLVALTILVLRGISYFVAKITPYYWRIQLVGVFPLSGGSGGESGGTICCASLYDASGRGYPMCGGWIEYQGKAPLYRLPEDLLKQLPRTQEGCLDFPATSPPGVVGNPDLSVYPFTVEIYLKEGMEEGWLRRGESTILEAKVYIQEEFTPGANLISLSPTQKARFVLRLDAPTFMISPPGETLGFLEVTKPMIKDWVIAPRADALGAQYLTLEVVDGDGLLSTVVPYLIEVEVREESGNTPVVTRLLAKLSSMLTVLVSAFSFIHLTMDTWKKGKSSWKRRSSKGRMHNFQLEKRVIALFRAKGYQVEPIAGRRGEIMVSKGRMQWIVQYKFAVVGERAVQSFYRTVQREEVKGGIIIAMNGFTSSAREWAKGKKLYLVSGKEFTALWRTITRS